MDCLWLLAEVERIRTDHTSHTDECPGIYIRHGLSYVGSAEYVIRSVVLLARFLEWISTYQKRIVLSGINKHPFPVEAHFEFSLVLTFAYELPILQDKIPRELELDTFDDKWGFLAVAMVQTKSLRPKGFPKFLGSDFFLIGYRIFVRYRSSINGNRMRGLYILKSETNKQRMRILGNLLTGYHYTKVDIHHQAMDDGQLSVRSNRTGFRVEVDASKHSETPIPEFSPFPSWQKARLYSGPLPFTFSIRRPSQEIVIVEGIRETWSPQPVRVLDHSIPFLREFSKEPPRLANAFIIHNIPYFWKRGRTEALAR